MPKFQTLQDRRTVVSVALGSLVIGAALFAACGFPRRPATAQEKGPGKKTEQAQPAAKVAPGVAVLIRHPGLAADAVERTITSPVERLLRGADGLRHVESRSVTGLCSIRVQFRDDIVPGVALAQVVSLVASVRPDLPAGTAAPQVFRFNPADPLPVAALVLDHPALNQVQREELVRRLVVDALAPLPVVVRQAPNPGGRVLEVFLDPMRMRALKVSAAAVLQALEPSPAPPLAGTIRVGKQLLPLEDRELDIKELGNSVVKMANGNRIFLRDIGSLKDAAPPPAALLRLNGRRQVGVLLSPGGGAGAAQVNEALKRVVPVVRKQLPEGATLHVLDFGTEGQARGHGLITIHLRAATGTSLEETEKQVAAVEAFLEKTIPAEARAFLLTDLGVPAAGPALSWENDGPQDATLRLRLTPAHAAKAPEYLRTLRGLFRKEFPALQASFHAGAGADWPIALRVGGGAPGQAEKLAQQLGDRVAKLKGAVDVHVGERFDLAAVQIRIDTAKAAALGLSQQDIHRQLAFATREGVTLPAAVRSSTGAAVPVVLRYLREAMKGVDDLGNRPIDSARINAPVPLSNVASIQLSKVPVEIHHSDGARVFTVRVNVEGRTAAAVVGEIEQELKGLQVPKGVWVKVGNIQGGGFVERNR